MRHDTLGFSAMHQVTEVHKKFGLITLSGPLEPSGDGVATDGCYWCAKCVNATGLSVYINPDYRGGALPFFPSFLSVTRGTNDPVYYFQVTSFWSVDAQSESKGIVNRLELAGYLDHSAITQLRLLGEADL